jgi:hypothetical protein
MDLTLEQPAKLDTDRSTDPRLSIWLPLPQRQDLCFWRAILKSKASVRLDVKFTANE